MKKLYMIVITLILVIGLGACNSAPDTNDYVTKDEMELEINQLWDILEDIGVIEGLNGQREYYIQDNEQPTSVLFTSVSAYEIELLGTELDKTKAPSYILDIDENYISFEELAQLLLTKYFDVNLNYTALGFQAKIVFNISSTDYTQEEIISRIILLIEEISHYDWYIIGSSEFYINIKYDMEYLNIKVPIQTMRSDFVTMTPEVIYSGWYEVWLQGWNYDNAIVQSLYDDYVTNETYIGYVLDYKE